MIIHAGVPGGGALAAYQAPEGDSVHQGEATQEATPQQQSLRKRLLRAVVGRSLGAAPTEEGREQGLQGDEQGAEIAAGGVGVHALRCAPGLLLARASSPG